MFDFVVQTVPSTPGGYVALITQTLEGWAGAVVAGLAGWLAAALPIIVTLAFVVYGIALWFGFAEARLGEFAGKILGVIFVIALTLGTALYFPLLFEFFVEGPDEVVRVVLASVSVSEQPAELLDLVWVEAFEAVTQIMSQGGWTNYTPYILALLVMVATFAFVLGVFGVVVIAKIGGSLMIAIAPLMILALPFKTSHAMFERWLGSLFTFAITPILANMVAALLMFMLRDAIFSDPNASFIWDLNRILPYLIISTLGFVVLLQVPNMAATIGGGIGLAGTGAVLALAGSVGLRVAMAGARVFGGPAPKAPRAT